MKEPKDKSKQPDTYPEGTVRALLKTDLVTPKTREVLEERLQQDLESAAPRFFNGATYRVLEAVCNRLIPQLERDQRINIASAIDLRLAEGKCDGWRYDVLPPDGEAYRLGLHGLDESARLQFGISFIALAGEQQDIILRAVQTGQANGDSWHQLDGQRFFEDLLAEAAEVYYSHPLAQEEIGYVGMADAHGWQMIGLNEREPQEPQPIEVSHDERS
jgi:gluconate 2-dehydrogenase gamma chain